MTIRGTQSKKLIAYIDRLMDHLGLYDLDTLVQVEIAKECANGAGGYCHGDDNDIQIEVARYDESGKIPADILMQNLAHEFIHAKQIAEGRLVNHGFIFRKNRTSEDDLGLSYKWEWEGKEYIDIPYSDHPWEHEAYALEEQVYNICK
jgi:hypothetical protein